MDTRTCFNCVWLRERGPHVGCFYGGEFRCWLSREKAETFPICMVPGLRRKQISDLVGARWQKSYEG